jgi:predicted nucleotidyltransferase
MLDKVALKEIAFRFNKAGLTWALGGSCMMQLQGIAVDPRDIDLFVDVNDFDVALEILSSDNTFTLHGPSGIFASKRYASGSFMGISVDLIAGFRIVTPPRTAEYVVDPKRLNYVDIDGIPVPSCLLEDWIELYEAMGKTMKADLIRNHLNNK